MAQVEKVSADQEKLASPTEQSFNNEEYREPPPAESLHRGLKARQISMIAVSSRVASGVLTVLTRNIRWEVLLERV